MDIEQQNRRALVAVCTALDLFLLLLRTLFIFYFQQETKSQVQCFCLLPLFPMFAKPLLIFSSFFFLFFFSFNIWGAREREIRKWKKWKGSFYFIFLIKRITWSSIPWRWLVRKIGAWSYASAGLKMRHWEIGTISVCVRQYVCTLLFLPCVRQTSLCSYYITQSQKKRGKKPEQHVSPVNNLAFCTCFCHCQKNIVYFTPWPNILSILSL